MEYLHPYDYDEDGYAHTDRYEVVSVTLDAAPEEEFWWDGHELEDAVAALNKALNTHGFNREFAIVDTWAGKTALRIRTIWPVF